MKLPTKELHCCFFGVVVVAVVGDANLAGNATVATDVVDAIATEVVVVNTTDDDGVVGVVQLTAE